MTVRSCSLLIATAGLGMALPLSAQEPGRLFEESGAVSTASSEPFSNQKLADLIAGHLRESGTLRHYRIDVRVEDGTAELTGTVADQPQHDEVLHIVRGVPGVARVVDHLAQVAGPALTAVQALSPPPVITTPPASAPSPYGAGFNVDPQPVFQAAAPGPYDLNPPKMPPYAWPTYAPYNNYSRVAYPTLYPYQAWPFIGPLYPFPKVPLGWRAVKLEWQDGHWWLSRYATPHDWWMLRYW